jgi:hypothetical protein
MTGQLDLALRVAVLLVVMVAPTLFFVALGWVLECLRDDELIGRVQADAGVNGSPTHTPVDTNDGVLSADADPGVTCPDCGATNMRDATYCQQCLRELSRE